MTILDRFRNWMGHRRTQRLIDENRRLLAERDRLRLRRGELIAAGVDPAVLEPIRR